MNILLVNPPGNISFINPPLGLLYISAVLKESNHNVSLIDYNIKKFSEQNLSNFIKEKKIKAVGISIVTPKVYNASALAKTIKNNFPGIILIAGGPHATLLPEQLISDCPAFDFVVQGEGEFRLRNLINNLEKNIPFDEIDGLAYKNNGEIINNPPKCFIDDLNKIPTPSRELVDIATYSKHMKTLYSPATSMMTSRGCPYQCIYCSKAVTGSKVRSLSPENVIKEIKFLVNDYKIKEIVFYDDSFTFNKDRVVKICDLIIENKLKIKWHCETRVNLVNKELLTKMKQAGCYMIGYGIESGSEKMLKKLKKGITLEQIRNTIKITNEAGIKVLGYFMVGIPEETKEDINETIKFSKQLNPDYVQFAIATAYPGTELYEIAKQQNKLTKDWSKSIYALGGKPIISLSDIPVEELYKNIQKAYFSFYFRPSYIIKKISELKNFRYFSYYIRGFLKLFKI